MWLRAIEAALDLKKAVGIGFGIEWLREILEELNQEITGIPTA